MHFNEFIKIGIKISDSFEMTNMWIFHKNEYKFQFETKKELLQNLAMDNYIDGSISSWKRYTVRLVKNHRIKLAYLATPLTTCNNKLSWIRQKRISSTRRFI